MTMATDYRLTVSGTTPMGEIAARAFPDPTERPNGAPPRLTADLYEKYGFGVTIYAGQNGYVEGETDTGMWEWEPSEYVRVSFHMGKESRTDSPSAYMLTVVNRVLTSGFE